MNTINANAGAGGYQLKSEMARVCLPAPHAHDQRNLAWTNSICLLFLIIGLAGFRPAPPPSIPVKPLEESAPVIIEAPPPPSPVVELKQDESPVEKQDSAPPQLVRVTRDSPAIKFAVPTPGNLVVPIEKSVAPPPDVAPRATAPSRPQPPQPGALENTGAGGERPIPEYPHMAEQLGQQGAVVLLLTADEAGVMLSVEVKESSGSSILDRAAADFVKRHWTVSPGARGRLYLAKIVYKI